MATPLSARNDWEANVELHAAIRTLGDFAAQLRWSDLTEVTRSAATDVLVDTIGVTIAGARTTELESLRSVYATTPGPCRPLGSAIQVPDVVAALLDGTAACALELDEGNKRARGHPAAHVLPAAMAIGNVIEASGTEWLAAFVAGHEIAFRVAAATHLHPGVHPHGNAGAAGAAAAAGRLLGLTGPEIAAAIDAATALPIATDFAAALDGSFVRNTWIGVANSNGILAARLAQAGLADVDGRAAGTLGRLLGVLNLDELTADLGDRFAVTSGYFKRHASCSYTHPPADAVLALRDRGVTANEVERIEVYTHRLAAALDRAEPATRLAAMFSIPYVVAATFHHGRFDVEASSESSRSNEQIAHLAAVTEVLHDPNLDERLPDERSARLTAHLRDGSKQTIEVPNPVGDTSYQPLDRAALHDKLDHLLRPGESAAIARWVEELASAPDMTQHLTKLP